MDFFLGLIIGVCLGVVGLFVFAWRLVSKAPEAKPQGVAAISMPLHTHRQAESIFHLPKGTA
jgi:hypothetical protein